MKPPPAWNGSWNGPWNDHWHGPWNDHFLDALSTAVLLFDDGLRLRSINAAGQVLLSLSPERAQGQPASRLLPGAERLFAIFSRALEADSPYVELGVELQRPNDAPLILDCVVTPVFEQNIHEVLEHVYGLMQAERPPGVELHRDYDPSLPEISADREQLVQVLLNVGRNALQAVGGRGEVRLRSLAQRRCTIGGRMHRLGIRVDVIDTGPGLPPDLNHTAFYPMVSGRPGGTGLGLPIAQALVQAHGGVLQYERLGEETIFSLLLPPRREP